MPHLLTIARRGALLLALAVLLVGVPACGCCDDHDDWQGGTLQVINDPQSFWELETVGISVGGGPVELFDVWLLPGDDAFIDLFPDDYDVDLWWSDGFFETYFDVPIWDDEVTPLLALNQNV